MAQQQERPLPSGHRREQLRNTETVRSCSLQRDMSGHGRGQPLPPQRHVLQENRQRAMQDIRQSVARPTGMQENRQPLPFQPAQASLTHQAASLELHQRTTPSQPGNLNQRSQGRLVELDELGNAYVINSADVTGKLTAEYGRMTGRIDNLQLCLNRSEETCREADAMKKRLQEDVLQLQKSNEQLTQQLQTEIGHRDNTETKAANVHSVCVMLAEHCERVRSSTDGIGMLEATLRKHQADLQAQVGKLDAEHNCLMAKCDKERDFLQGLLNTEREIRMREITNANALVAKCKLELNDVSRRLQAEQDVKARNLALLEERENKIKELEESSANQAKSFEYRLCDSDNALSSATSEIESLRQALMNLQLTDKDNQHQIVMLEKDKSKMQEDILITEKKVQKMESCIETLINEKNELSLQLKSTEYELISCRNEKVTLTQKLEDTRNHIQRLANENDIVSGRLLAAQKSNSDLETVNSEIVVKLLAANASLDSFTSERIKLMNELQEANSSVKLLTEAKEEAECNLRNVTETLEKEKSEALSALQETKLSIESLEMKESEVTEKLTAAHQLIDTLQAEKNDILGQLQSVGDSAKSVELEKNEVYQKLVLAEAAVNSLMLEKKEILDQLVCAKSTMTCLELEKNEALAKLVEAEGVINNLNALKDELTAELDLTKTSIGVLEEQVAEALEKMASAEERYNTLVAEQQQVMKDLSEMRNSIEKLEVEKSELNEQLSSATASANALELENAALLQQLKSVESKIQTLQLDMKQVAEEMQNREEALHVLQGEKRDAMKELEEAKNAIQALESEKEEFSNKLQEAESTNVTTGKKDLKKIKTLESKILALEKDKTKLTAGLQSSKAEVNALKEQIKTDEAEIVDKMAALEVEAESEKAKVVEKLQTVESELDCLKSENKKLIETHRLAENQKESLVRKMGDLEKQFEDSLTLVKDLQIQKNEEILKSKDIQKGVESYKQAFIQQKNDIEAEKAKYLKELATLTNKMSAQQQEHTQLATEKRDVENKFKSEEKTWKSTRLKLAKATNHYREQVKQLKFELAKIGKISSASAANIAFSEQGDMTTPKSCLRATKHLQTPIVDPVFVQAPKKRVMFDLMDSESETDDSLETNRTAKHRSKSAAKKMCFPEERDASSSKTDSAKSKRAANEETYGKVEFNSLFDT